MPRSRATMAVNAALSCTVSSRGRSNGMRRSATTTAGRRVITSTRSLSSTASRMEWVMKMPVLRCRAHRSSSTSAISSRVMASSALKGSSISMMEGSWMRDRHRATRWRIPPESSRGRLPMKSARPTSDSNASARARYAARSSRIILIGKSTLSRALSQGSSVASWNTRPASRRGPVMAVPPTVMVPAVSGSSPASIISRVDLPQPDGPRMETNSPSATSKLTPATASTGPAGEA